MIYPVDSAIHTVNNWDQIVIYHSKRKRQQNLLT